MKILKTLGIVSVLFVIFDFMRAFFNRYEIGIHYVDKFEEEDQEFLVPDYDNAVDMRGTPTHVCICGCDIWNLKASFEDYQISTYFLDMECANCGSLATAPTPVDREGM